MPNSLTNYERDFLERFDTEHIFSEEEIENMFYDLEEYEEHSYDKGRWTMPMTTIFRVGDRFIGVDWEAGLTEYQENSYENQPYEVFPKQEQVVVTRWYTKNGVLID